ncbi:MULTISPECIES: hypothetical protein [unclassified Polaromonas]|jgi:hypothetical protein|uniref:hypothetical protein n=1 Tax=unclassified Polaromonas TaxID=2638319 RepID=UPI0025F29537|nr:MULTISPECIES: hypothetical protein [unclassified Polaromonas]HQR99535.1 hypothetical protein [Polaromonas sp.]
MTISLHVGTSADGRSLLHYGGTLGAALSANHLITRESCFSFDKLWANGRKLPVMI